MNKTFDKLIEKEELAAGEAAGASDAAKGKPYTTLGDLGEIKPEEEDESVLFKGNWLGQGGGLLITAPSGVGKSSLVIQALCCWTLGKKFLAQPNGRRLRCALIQSEDSKRDLQEIRDGMKRGFREAGWNPEEIEEAVNGIHIWTCVGKTGDAFIAWLRQQQVKDPCDIVAINPIQGFFGGDVSKQEDVSHFLREGLDPILKGEDGLHPCAAVLVQHTPKISTGQKDCGAEIDSYSEYLGAGSHEWLDWCRAKFVFLKKKNAEGFFDLKAAKRGKRLKWIGSDGKPTTRIVLAHTEGYIFWRIVTQEELDKLNVGSGKNSTMAKEKADHDKGEAANLQTIVDHITSEVLKGAKLTNGDLRKWAEQYWEKGVARKLITKFEACREDKGIVKTDGHYDIGKQKSA